MRLFTVTAFCALFTLVSISYGATPLPQDVNQVDGERYTPLMRAAQRGQVNVVRFLLKRGAEVDAKHPMGFTALMLAAQKGNLPVVTVLLDAGANPNVTVATPHFGRISTLIWGIMSGNQAVVQALIKGGAEINPRIDDGSTPLMMAVQSGSVRIVKTLLAAGADVNGRGINSYTPLMVAVEDRFELTKLLIEAGADVRVKNKFGETPLFLAKKRANDEIVAMLKRAGAKE